MRHAEQYGRGETCVARCAGRGVLCEKARQDGRGEVCRARPVRRDRRDVRCLLECMNHDTLVHALVHALVHVLVHDLVIVLVLV